MVILPLRLPVNPPVAIILPVTARPLGKLIVPEIYEDVAAEVADPDREPVIPAKTESEWNL